MIDELEFVSYNGDYPNLCSGILVLRLDGKEIIFPKYCLCSGGNVSFDENWSEEVTEGRWDISEFPEGFPKNLKERAINLVNENITWGCCGGCV